MTKRGHFMVLAQPNSSLPVCAPAVPRRWWHDRQPEDRSDQHENLIGTELVPGAQ